MPVQAFRRYLLDRMVLRPSRDPIEFSPQRRVMLGEATRPLECFVQSNFDDTSDAPDLLVLKFPGTAGRAERSTPFPMSMLGDRRVEMWTWNPPGYGRSGGRASLGRIADAALEFWSDVTERYAGTSARVWLCGNSLGCVTALHVAASGQPYPHGAGIILRNPPPLKPVVKRVARQYPLGGWLDPVVETLCESMNAMATAGRVNLPAVFLQSELDSLVPVSYQNELIAAYNGPRRVVLLEGLGHACLATPEHENLIQQSVQWLWQTSACNHHESPSAH